MWLTYSIAQRCVTRALVIPGRAKGASPESIATSMYMTFGRRLQSRVLRLWIPSSSLRSAPE